jgi:hypothetical protein
MATKARRRPSPTGRDDDPNGRYVIKYRPFNPCVRPDAPFVPTLRARVTGKRNMETTRAALRAGGATIVSVTRTNWFS